MNNAIQVKGCDTVRLTTVKGHATDDMVKQGQVNQEGKEGNEEADDSADRGAKDLQPGLAAVAGCYARKHQRYKQVMTNIHTLTVEIKNGVKAEEGKEEAGK